MTDIEHLNENEEWPASGWVQVAPALLIVLATIVAGFAAFYAPPKIGEMGVVFAPWTDQVEAINAIVAAGGRFVDSSRLGNVVIAYALDEEFETRVRQHGAWFTVAARGLCAADQG